MGMRRVCGLHHPYLGPTTTLHAGLIVRDQWAERTWRPLGERDPYFAVCNEPQYRAGTLDAAARAEFFASGEQHVAWVDAFVRSTVAPNFAPRRALDFGCGVGRLTLPLGNRAAEVVGCDVSVGMLAEAERNRAEAGLSNVRFARSDDQLGDVTGTFDFIHSFIVFQHIPTARGLAIAAALVDRLRPGGVGALHFTYRRAAPAWRRAVHHLRRAVPGVNAVVNLAQRRPVDEPMFPMYEYPLHALFDLVTARGCGRVHVAFTDHGGHLGALLVFRTPESAPEM